MVMCTVCKIKLQRNRIRRHYTRDKTNDRVHQDRFAQVQKAENDQGVRRKRKKIAKVVATEALFTELISINPFQMAARKKFPISSPDKKKDIVMTPSSKPKTKKEPLPSFLMKILENESQTEDIVGKNEMVQALGAKFVVTMERYRHEQEQQLSELKRELQVKTEKRLSEMEMKF